MSPGSNVRFGPYSLDTAVRRLWRGKQEILLAPKALELLSYLAERPNVVVSRAELFTALWPGTFVEDHALSVQILDIRKALGDKTYIETRPRRGYRFVIPEDGDDAPTPSAPAAPAPTPTLQPPPMPVTRYARSGDVNIAYQVMGDGPIDLVFVMGWVSHIDYYWTHPLFSRFLTRLATFSRLILFDKRGTGLSDRVPLSGLPTLEERMDDVRAVMQAVGSNRAAILGVSEGGPMSALFAATYPERTFALVMIGSYARRLQDGDYPWGPTLEERDSFCRYIMDQWGGPVGIDTRAPSLINDTRFRDWWATYLRMGASPGAAVALTRMNAEIDVRDVLPSVRVPTLVIHRSEDMCLRVEEGRYLAAGIPGARFVELPGADHLPFVGDQDAILDEVEAFLRGADRDMQVDRVLVTVLVAEFRPALSSALLGRLAGEVEWARGKWMTPPLGPCTSALAVFDGPARSIRCAAAMAKHAAQMGIESRAGLHTGECDKAPDGTISGPTAELAGAICSQAGWNTVVVSSILKDLAAGSGIEFAHRNPPISNEDGEWKLYCVRTATPSRAAVR